MSYREQFIWKKGIDLAVECCGLTQDFPKSELYGIVSQIRRSSVSVASNIAEGYGRKTTGEYVHFLHIALGSLRELDTQLIISQRVGFGEQESLIALLNDVETMQKITVATINRLKGEEEGRKQREELRQRAGSRGKGGKGKS